MTTALALHTGSLDYDWRRRRLVSQNHESHRGLYSPAIIPNENQRSQTAVFETASPSDWVLPVLQRIDELLNLPPNWDCQGAREVRSDVVTFGVNLLFGIMLQTTSAPQILPVSSGGLQMEWHEKGIDLEIEIEAPNQIYVSFEDAITGETFDRELSTNFAVLTDPVKRLTER